MVMRLCPDTQLELGSYAETKFDPDTKEDQRTRIDSRMIELPVLFICARLLMKFDHLCVELS